MKFKKEICPLVQGCSGCSECEVEEKENDPETVFFEKAEIKRKLELIETFVADNFVTDGCRECHEIGYNIVPDCYTEKDEKDYEKAITKLLKELEKLR